MLLTLLTLLAAPPLLEPLPGNLEGAWLFAADPADVGERDGWALPGFDDSAWRILDVPGSWEPQGVTEPRPGQPPRPTTPQMRWTDYDGVAWYRRTVTVPADWAGRPLVLNLGSVDDLDRAYVGGRLVGETPPDTPNAVQRWRRYAVPAEAITFGGPTVIALRVTDLGGPGGVDGPMVGLLPADITSDAMKLPAEDRPTAERFADPPGSTRIMRIRHGWPDDLESARLQLHGDLADGFGGVATNVRWKQYLEDPAAWDQLRAVIAEARSLNMALWLYDEEGYPSLAAGGLVLREHPEWESEGLYYADAVTTGAPVELLTPPGERLACLAVPIVDGVLDPAGARPLDPPPGDAFAWTPPAGTWHVMVISRAPLYEGTHATSNVFQSRRHPNMLVPEATQLFLRLTHDRYAAELGDLSLFQSTFTDEPSLMSAFLRPQPWRPIPWSPTFAADYQERWGEDLLPLLPTLVGDAGDLSARTRYRFWKLVGEQVARNYFRAIRDWCAQHNLLSGGHLIFEESLLMHVPMYGDFFACARELTAPSIDCLTSLPHDVPPQIGRLIASAGELTGHTQTMSEASDHVQRYRPEGNTTPIREVTEAEIRGSLNRQMVTGINTFTSYYSFAGLGRDERRRLNRHVGRVNTVLRGGHQVADIAVVYPVDSVWPHYVPRGHMATNDPTAVAIANAYQSVTDQLFTAGRDYCFVDAQALIDSSVDGDSLVHGELRWRVLVLPGVETLPPVAWSRIRQFLEAGGAVVAIGPLPRNTDAEFPSPIAAEVEAALRRRGVVLDSGGEVLLPSVIDRLLERDLAFPADAPLRVTHRRVDDHDAYLVINDSPEPWSGEVSTVATGAGELWQPADGTMTPARATDVPLSLEPYGAAILRYPATRPRQRRGRAGEVPEPTLLPLPTEPPGEGHGQFVEATLTPGEEDGRPHWTAAARLTKSDVDCHLFVTFGVRDAVALTESAFLVVDTYVPPTATSGPPLLVMVGERGGAVWLAETARSLGRPGWQRSYVPWDRFRHGSWTTDASGVLEREAIEAIMVGWGGHFGREGDRIEFATRAPAAGRVEQP